MKAHNIHINCDLGEGMANEAAMFPYIDACNLACGGHFGDEKTLKTSMALAKQHNVVCGAHPSYPDLENFGRQAMSMKKEAFVNSIQEQLNLFMEVYQEYFPNEKLPHIKAHGALYNDLCTNKILASWYLEAIELFKPVTIFTLSHGVLSELATATGSQIVKEAFLDRAYTADGFLKPRDQAGSVLETAAAVMLQLPILQKKGAQTYCIHGDHPNSLDILKQIRQTKI